MLAVVAGRVTRGEVGQCVGPASRYFHQMIDATGTELAPR